MERESLRGLWKRCITCVFVQNFGFVSQPTRVVQLRQFQGFAVFFKPSKVSAIFGQKEIFLGSETHLFLFFVQFPTRHRLSRANLLRSNFWFFRAPRF